MNKFLNKNSKKKWDHIVFDLFVPAHTALAAHLVQENVNAMDDNMPEREKDK